MEISLFSTDSSCRKFNKIIKFMLNQKNILFIILLGLLLSILFILNNIDKSNPNRTLISFRLINEN